MPSSRINKLANVSKKVWPEISNPFHRKPFLTQSDFRRNLVTLQMPELSSIVRKKLVAKYQIPVAISSRTAWARSCSFWPQEVVYPVTAAKGPTTKRVQPQEYLTKNVFKKFSRSEKKLEPSFPKSPIRLIMRVPA